MYRWKGFVLLITIGLISLIAMKTIVAQDNNGHGNGNGKGQDKPTEVVQPTQPPSNNGSHQDNNNGNSGKKDNSQPVVSATDAPVTSAGQPSDGTLGCQKNNSGRLDCSSLDVKGVCSNGMAVFTIHNSGSPGDGDMRAAIQYRLVVNGVVVETGSVQLAGGASGQVTYSGGGSVTFEVDQQVGHPGNSHPRITLDCGGAAETPTVEPTQEVTPTVEPTEEITPTLEPALAVDVICKDDGSIVFLITNNGGDMLNSVAYMVSDTDNNIIDSGEVQLTASGQTSLQYSGEVGLTLTVGDLIVVASPECVPSTPPVTPEPTQEVTPTVEPTNTFDLVGQADCNADGSITFTINNVGADMTHPEYYTVTDSGNMLVADGYFQMMVGQPLVLTFAGYTSLTFTMSNLVVTSPDCGTSTPEPTPEVSPTPEPTQEVTPTVQPTEEVTPSPTPAGTLGCQKNNPDRKDCSSLQVSGTCQGGVAVFTIRNMGEPGEGDMVSATQYRIIVNGVVVETGTVQLKGRTGVQITYSGTGNVTLEADQQVGHPGKSQPQATVSCSA